MGVKREDKANYLEIYMEAKVEELVAIGFSKENPTVCYCYITIGHCLLTDYSVLPDKPIILLTQM